MELPNIDRLLKADEINVQTMRQFFADVSEELPTLLNEPVVLYETCGRSFGQGMAEQIGSVTGIDDVCLQLIQAQIKRGLLLARIGTLDAMEVADFLRMRITAPLAYVRLQCESFAFIKLFGEDPASVKEWQGISSDEEGRRFFRKHQMHVKTILETYDLSDTYNRASGVSLHSRFLGLARGFKIAQSDDGYRVTQSYRINAQEFDPEHRYYFITEVLFTLRAQGHILANLHDAAPEITDRLLLETRIPQFLERLTRFDAELRNRYSAQMSAGGQTGE